MLPLRLANATMTLLFLVAAALQHNDPDPVPWMAVYGAAALAAGLATAERQRWPLPAAVGVAALIWAATMAPRVLGGGMLRDLGQSMGPGTDAEEAREFLGLLIVVAWMAVLLALRRRFGRGRISRRA